MPVEYIRRINEYYAKQGKPPFQFSHHEAAPLTPLKKPLGQCKVALVASGGIYHAAQEKYQDLDDLSLREIPKDVNVAELKIHHLGYNHADADKDVNVVFPIERMRELEKEGFIREVASPAYSFMGRIYSRLRLVKETAPLLAEKLRKAAVDACLLVPA